MNSSSNLQQQEDPSCSVAAGILRPARWLASPSLAALLGLGFAATTASAATMTDLFAGRPMLSGVNATFDGNSTAAGAELDEPNHDGARRRTVWGAWTAPGNGQVVIDTLGSSFDTVLAVYVGDILASLAPVARNRDIDGTAFPASRVSFPTKAGMTYAIAVDGQANNANGNGIVRVNVAFTARAQPAAEVGTDDFDARPTLAAGAAALGACNNRFAKLENFETNRIPDRGCTVWWRWIAPDNGTVVMDTLESDFDTALTVYVGNHFTNLSEVALSLDVPNGTRSQVAFQARAGQEYQIMVDGQYANASGYGNAVLKVAWSANALPGAVPGANAFARRGQLAGSNAEGVAMNWLFNTDPFEPGHGSARGKTAWWEWTAPADGSVRIRTEGSDFNTHLAVYTGTSLTDLRSVASNNDVPGGTWSQVTFTAQRGQGYLIVVDGFFANASGYGNIRLRVDQAVQPSETLALYPAVELEIPGLQGVRYQLQASPNLRDWTNVGGVLQGTGAPIRILEATRGTAHKHFRYRIVP